MHTLRAVRIRALPKQAIGAKNPFSIICPPLSCPLTNLPSHQQMVLHHHGHRHRQHPPNHHPLPSPLAVLAIRPLLRPKHHPLLLRLHHLRPAIYPLPGDLGRHDSRSDEFLVFGDDSDGVCYVGEYVGVCVCAGLGGVGGDGGVGVVDGGCGCFCGGDAVDVDIAVCVASPSLLSVLPLVPPGHSPGAM
jgi:hypothetical protein